MGRKTRAYVAALAMIGGAAMVFAAGQRMTPGGKWRPGDMNRPRPAVVDPGTASAAEKPGQPPSDAVILFDGKDMSQWLRDGSQEAPRWKVENGYAEVRGGSITCKPKFSDAQIHIEWAAPAEVKGNSQGRGNSGVYIHGHGEIQVLDSYQNDTYPDGQAAALYNKYPPLVNASRKPGEWQTYDIIIHVPRFDAQGQVTQPAKLTVLHNGVVVHHAIDTQGRAREWQIGLQDHGNPVRYRNMWVRPLKDYDEK